MQGRQGLPSFPDIGETLHMTKVTPAALLAVLLALSAPAGANDPAAAATPAAPPAPLDFSTLAPFPADKTVNQSIMLEGRKLQYQATVGSLPVLDETGKTIAEVVFTAYTMPGKDRPVTFALNGGPGASSVYLNLGTMGPKRVQFGDNGDSPSAPALLRDNPGTWLDFTDLVFIDPVGTGFSRARIAPEEAGKRFYAVQPDIEYLSRIIYDWLVKHGRLLSPKYIAGESYGGFRAPRITHYLQTNLGVAMNGMVLVSPALELATSLPSELSPMPYVESLVTVAAAHLERQGRLSDAAMEQVIEYLRGEYVVDFMKGSRDTDAVARMSRRLAELTGVPEDFIRSKAGRLSSNDAMREVHRLQGKVGSVYDINVTAWDPFPYSSLKRAGDPVLDGIIAPTTTAMVHFVTQTVGWKVPARYYALNMEMRWDIEGTGGGAVDQLHRSIAIDPKLKVLIVHGWGDLACTYMNSRLIVDNLPVMGDPARVQLKAYPGGHMFYSRPASQDAFRRDVAGMYGMH